MFFENKKQNKKPHVGAASAAKSLQSCPTLDETKIKLEQ